MRYDENPQLNAFFEKMKGKEWREWTFEEWMELQRLKPLRRKNSLFLDTAKKTADYVFSLIMICTVICFLISLLYFF